MGAASLQIERRAVFRTGIPQREYLAGLAEVDAKVEAEIAALLLNHSNPDQVLAKMLREWLTGAGKDVLDAVMAMNGCDPDDALGCFDAIRDEAYRWLNEVAG